VGEVIIDNYIRASRDVILRRSGFQVKAVVIELTRFEFKRLTQDMRSYGYFSSRMETYDGKATIFRYKKAHSLSERTTAESALEENEDILLESNSNARGMLPILFPPTPAAT
jgi:hypothetical protein